MTVTVLQKNQNLLLVKFGTETGSAVWVVQVIEPAEVISIEKFRQTQARKA